MGRCSTARRAIVALICTLITGGAVTTTAAAAPPKASWDREKVRALIAQMTLEEKARMLYGAGDDRTCSETYSGCWRQRSLPGVPRLGVPPLRMADGPGGVRLGYGGGFFDRALAAITPTPLRIGVAYTNGFLPMLRGAADERPLDVILTEDGVMWQAG